MVPNLTHGWLSDETKSLLAATLTPETKLVVELGAWLGLSTRFIAHRAPQSKIITVDHWQGSEEHQTDPNLARLLPQLYERFLTNCWHLKDRLVPLKMSTQAGLEEISKAELQPDVVYTDADHSYAGARADIATACRLFPAATIVGDDWDWEGVQRAAKEIAQETRRVLQFNTTAWILRPNTGS